MGKVAAVIPMDANDLLAVSPKLLAQAILHRRERLAEIIPDDLEERIRKSKKDYTPWMKIEWEMLTASYKREIENKIGIKL